MTEKDILMIKHSWSYITGQLEGFGEQFARNLKRISPNRENLIRRLEKQKTFIDLIQIVHEIVIELPGIKQAEKHVENVYRQFTPYEASRLDFDNALIAFLMTLEKKLGPAFTREIRDSWVFLFATLSQRIPKSLTRKNHIIESPKSPVL